MVLIDQLGLAFVQRGLLELSLLAIISGALGPWIVLRSASFFAHAVGTAAFPGLIAADALGIAPQAGAAAAAALVTGGAGTLTSSRDGTRTALWLTGSLAVGALIASNASHPSPGVDSALFGSLLLASTGDLLTALAVAVASLLAAFIAGPRWLAAGLRARRSGHWESLLFVLIGAAAIAQLAAAGSLLAGAILVLPAVAARPWIARLASWHIACAVTALTVGITGLAISLQYDLPSGAVIAVVAGAAAAISHLAAALQRSSSRRPAALAAAALGAAISLAGCSSPNEQHGVVATTPIIGSIAAAVAGSDIPVVSIIPPGADPHEYEPRPSALTELGNAKLILASGAGMDGWVTRLADRAGTKAQTVDLSKVIPVLRAGDSPGSFDPHWFHDPRNVAAAADAIAARLEQIDPAHAGHYRSRAAGFAAEAVVLDRSARACVSRLSGSERNLVTDHDAFGYLAARLGLKVIGTVIPSQSSAAAPSAQSLDRLAATIRRLRVKAIFPERSLEPRLANALARETSASSAVQLDADTLGPAGSPTGTWAGMWQGNVERLSAALSGGRVKCNLGAAT